MKFFHFFSFYDLKEENLYNNKLEGIIDLDMYKKMTNRITEETIAKQNGVKKINTKICNIRNNIVVISKKYNDIVKEYLSIKKTNVQLLLSIIDRKVKTVLKK